MTSSAQVAEKSMTRLVIIGAGFAGITLAKALRHQPFDVLVLDANNYHTFQPLLYQVATGGLEPDSIAYPVRRIFRGMNNVRFQMADVKGVDLAAKKVITSVGSIDYDILVLANGSTNNFYSFEALKNNFFPLKSVADALNIRSYMMQNLERAVSVNETSQRSELINIAIVGGGPSGIELAGALAEMKRHVLPKDFPQIDFNLMAISLFEASPKLLANMSADSSGKSLEYLTSMGVNVHLDATVTAYDNRQLTLQDGSTFATHLVIWTAGVKGNAIDGIPADIVLPGNRIQVDKCYQVPGIDNVFAIGDVASCSDDTYPKGLPMLATIAIQQGKHLAKNLVLRNQGKVMLPFVFKSRGTMATIGRNKAVVDLPGWNFQGTFAWFVWMLVHLISLVGFRNKLVCLLTWMYSYFNYDRPLGLIIRPFIKTGNTASPTDNNKTI